MDSTQRFTSRVEDYIKYRPSYPSEIVDLLRAECGLSADSVLADVGSGTGILSRELLDGGFQVIGIEPNDAMRAAAEHTLADEPRFTSIDATAEQTTLDAASVDLITAGQAFHWFDPVAARAEFVRIGKSDCPIALIWNDRQTDSDEFHRAYEQLLLKLAPMYPTLHHRRIGEKDIADFFAPAPFELTRFPNQQVFDFDGFAGRLDSSSYAPQPGDENYESMRAELTALFDKHQVDGKIKVDYDTKVYYGQLSG